MKGKVQDLEMFRVPPGFRGRPAWFVQLWWLAQSTVFGLSPQFMFGWRRFILRLFGARIGKNVLIRPSVKVTYPWKVSIGDRAWVGDDAVLYSLGEIVIGNDSVISQRCYICAAAHDYSKPGFDIYAKKIEIGNEVWVATGVFVAPGVRIGDGVVVGAGSNVFTSLPPFMVCYGSPAKPVRKRESR